MSEFIFFVGPSAYGLSRPAQQLLADHRIESPVRRGDVARVVHDRRNSEPASLVIVDGNFHQCLAVGHVELRRALEAGWTVWGLASMGAIRAWEMRDLGMRGFGDVYRSFACEDDFRDDEVTLLHQPEASYRAVSEPLVHLRLAARSLRREGLLGARGREAVIADLANRWYGERTVALFTRLVLAHADAGQETAIADHLADFSRFRQKTRDLEHFLGAVSAQTLSPGEQCR